MGIDRNETDDPVAWHGSLLLFIGSEPVLTPAEVAEGVMRA